MKYLVGFLILIASPAVAQQPHVEDLLKQLDTNSDGWLSKTEVAKNQRYARQFPRWDTDGDAKVTKKDIVAFRAKFGIAADGTRLRGGNSDQPSPKLMIPKVSDLTRVDKQTRLNRSVAANSQFILKTSPHSVSGDGYFILTDHHSNDYMEPLRKLAEYRNATIIAIDDLAVIHKKTKSIELLRDQLIKGKAKYVAIAPRMESFLENMLLGMWELLSTIDEDPQLDCYPGILVTSNAESFAKLIEQSISHQPISNQKLKPFAINQVQSSRETRSLQKSGILRKHFQTAKLKTPIVAIYGPTANAAPRLEGEKVWNLTVQSKRKFIKKFPPEANAEFQKSNLVVMHGHGIPGMSCSLDVDGLPKDLTGKIILTGSCFSASPQKSDLAAMRQAPGGYEVENRDAFVLRSIDNGALVAFGHQRLSSGFPHLYPVLENWLEGQTVGQAYQQLINALIEYSDTKSGSFIIGDSQKASKRLPQNRFLYVIVGDPAVQPFERHALLSRKN